MIIVTLIAATGVKAQRPETGGWFTMQLPVNFTKHWQWHNDASYRTLGVSVAPIQYLYRTGLRYNFNKQWNTAAGVAFFFTRTVFSKANKEFGFEFRTWEEVNHQLPVNDKLLLQFRLRTEQRFFSATNVDTKYTAHRFRFRTGFTKKINDKWSFQITNEIMQQQANHKLSFNQNRLMISGIYHLRNNIQLQGGYLWLRWPTEDQQIATIGLVKNITWHGE